MFNGETDAIFSPKTPSAVAGITAAAGAAAGASSTSERRRPIAQLGGFGTVVIAELECSQTDPAHNRLALFDSLSREIGAIMRERIREEDLFGLVDNRHFVLILKGSGPREATAVMDRVRAALCANPGFQAFGLGIRYGLAELDMNDQIGSLARATDHLREVRRREERLRKAAHQHVA